MLNEPVVVADDIEDVISLLGLIAFMHVARRADTQAGNNQESSNDPSGLAHWQLFKGFGLLIDRFQELDEISPLGCVRNEMHARAAVVVLRAIQHLVER